MVKVENKETLRLLTSRFMKMNRARNVIAVIAIILTSLLFTSLFVGSVSMILSKRATELSSLWILPMPVHRICQKKMQSDCRKQSNRVNRWNDMVQVFSGSWNG